MTRGRPGDSKWLLPGLLGVALGLRVAVIAGLGAHTWFAGGDGPWYVQQGWLIAHASLREPLRTVGPLYPLTLAGLWRVFPGHPFPAEPLAVAAAYLTVVRLLQATIGALTAAVTYLLGRQLELDRKSALVAAAGVGIGPAFVIEPFLIRTEPLFMACLTGAVLLFVVGERTSRLLVLALAGGVCACGALTRPVLLLFPAVLAVPLLLRGGLATGARQSGALLLGAFLTLAPWHVWLYRETGRFLPEGFSVNFWMGSQLKGQPLDHQTFHAKERELAVSRRGFLGDALHRVSADPVGWLARRARNILESLLQPHGTSDLGGPSVKAGIARWLRDDRSARGLFVFASAPTFWVRVLTYVFHYGGLGLALAGVWATWPRRRAWFPVYAAALYIVLVYALLVAIPRYLFPAQPFLWTLAGAGIAGRSRSGRESREQLDGSQLGVPPPADPRESG